MVATVLLCFADGLLTLVVITAARRSQREAGGKIGIGGPKNGPKSAEPGIYVPTLSWGVLSHVKNAVIRAVVRRLGFGSSVYAYFAVPDKETSL